MAVPGLRCCAWLSLVQRVALLCDQEKNQKYMINSRHKCHPSCAGLLGLLQQTTPRMEGLSDTVLA